MYSVKFSSKSLHIKNFKTFIPENFGKHDHLFVKFNFSLQEMKYKLIWKKPTRLEYRSNQISNMFYKDQSLNLAI